MKKTYMIPAISVVDTIVESQILAGSLKLSDEQVSEGWAKESGEWDDIWAEGEE